MTQRGTPAVASGQGHGSTSLGKTGTETGLDAEVRAELAELERRDLRRELPGAAAGLDFLSNDYLGLSDDPRLIEAGKVALERYPAGGRASRLLAGGSEPHRSVERLAAEWQGTEAALLFATGYQANLGLIGALAGPETVLFSDALNHASLIDGARLAKARAERFPHADLAALDRQLRANASAARRLILVEAVYGMDGDASPLAELAELAAAHDAWLLVDEAHSAGVLGPDGAGLSATLEPALRERVALRLITGGKALGAGGALACGSAALIELLVNRARSFVFTTAPPPVVAAMLQRGIEIASSSPELRDASRTNARALARAIGAPEPAAAVVPAIFGAARPALEAAERLQAEGFAVRAVRPPTVPENTARLRLIARADHDPADIHRLGSALRPLLDAARQAVTSQAPTTQATALVLAGTDTDVGKTIVSALLVRALKLRYWKPVQTGDDDDTSTVRRLAQLPADREHAPAARYALPASPHEAAAAEDAELDVSMLEPRLRELLESDSRPLLIELAGGLHVPLTLHHTQIDQLARHPRPIVLVARSGLGTLNHTLLSLESLRTRGLHCRALFLVGAPHPSNAATLRALSGVPHVFELPLLQPLHTAALDDWISAHDLSGILP